MSPEHTDIAVDVDSDMGHVSTECHGTDLIGEVEPVVLHFTVMPDKSIYVENETKEVFSVSQSGAWYGENRPSYGRTCAYNFIKGSGRCNPIFIDRPFYDCYLTSSNPSLTAQQKKAVDTVFRSIWTTFPEIVTVRK